MSAPTIQSPQTFVVREECEKAAWQNGYRRKIGETEGWAAFGSTTAHGTVYLAAVGNRGPWFLALDHAGVIEALNLPSVDMPGSGLGRYVFDTPGALYAVLSRVYRLAASLPNAPLREFQAKVKDLPKTTEAERLVVQRIGQDIFRTALDNYWEGACAVTGITDRAMLRASHIKRWADCDTDAERLDAHNGFLLAAHFDAAFDAALITFSQNGEIKYSSELTEAAKAILLKSEPPKINLTDGHRHYLENHQVRFRT
jgi:HNH endonuclease